MSDTAFAEQPLLFTPEVKESACKDAGLDEAAVLHVRPFSVPPSDFVSPEFIAAYTRHVGFVRVFGNRARPQRDAPACEWDAYEADYVENYTGPILARNLARYPISCVDTEIAGVRVGIVTPAAGVASENAGCVLMNVRGGGFVLGRGLITGQIESIPIAALGRIKVVTIDFRQSPQHQYPAATDDIQAVYKALLKQYEPESVGIFGSSSGAILATQALAWMQENELPTPAAAGIFWAGVVPFGKRGDTDLWGVKGVPTAVSHTDVSALRGYMGGVDVDDAKVFPGCSETVLARFPPTLLMSGTRSGELSSVAVTHARLLALGVDASLYIMEGGWHWAAVDAPDAPEAVNANAYIARWFMQRLKH